MKTIQTIVLAASIILVSASATAGTLQAGNDIDRTGSNTLVVSAASTKQAAYQLGLSKLTQLKASSAQQLSQVLSVNSSTINGYTLHLKDGGYVTVEERMDAKGNVSYVSFVNVGFHYLERRDDNNG